MNYLYFPGCSLKGTAPEYDLSARTVMQALGSELQELEDWTCCGASAAETVSPLLSLALPARNLALAERMAGNGDDVQVVASCSACYVNLRKVEERAAEEPATLERINQVLEVDGLRYSGRTRVRHLLDVIANDFGPEIIGRRVQRPLTGLRVAPYYGCQTVRPYSPFDAPDFPSSMEGTLEALGVQVWPNLMAAACCGGTLMTTKRDVGVHLVKELLSAVEGADCLVTVCPLCQMNLDAYQKLVSKELGHPLQIPILYLTQLLGLAFGLPVESLGLKHNIVPFEYSKVIPEG